MPKHRLFSMPVNSEQLVKLDKLVPHLDALIVQYSAPDALKTRNAKRDAWNEISYITGVLGWNDSQPVRLRKLLKEVDSWRDARRTLATFAPFEHLDVLAMLRRMREALEKDLQEYRKEGFRQAQVAASVLERAKARYDTPFPRRGAIDKATKALLLQELQAEMVKAERHMAVIRDAIGSLDDLNEICRFIQIPEPASDASRPFATASNTSAATALKG
jgi:hypothetical protein